MVPHLQPMIVEPVPSQSCLTGRSWQTRGESVVPFQASHSKDTGGETSHSKSVGNWYIENVGTFTSGDGKQPPAGTVAAAWGVPACIAAYSLMWQTASHRARPSINCGTVGWSCQAARSWLTTSLQVGSVLGTSAGRTLGTVPGPREPAESIAAATVRNRMARRPAMAADSALRLTIVSPFCGKSLPVLGQMGNELTARRRSRSARSPCRLWPRWAPAWAGGPRARP